MVNKKRDYRRKNGTTKKYNISRIEWVIVLGFAVFGIIWALMMPTIAINPLYLSLAPPLQYITYNIGVLLLITAVLGTPLDYFFENKVSILGMIKSGIFSFTIFAVLDLWQPPLAYSQAGVIVITEAEALPGAAIDRAIGWIWTLVGIPDTNLFLFVYVVAPILMLLAAAILLRPDQLLKLVDK